jgi:hypothetical protein
MNPGYKLIWVQIAASLKSEFFDSYVSLFSDG